MILRFHFRDDLIVLHAEPDGAGWRVRLPDGSEHRMTSSRSPDEVMHIVAHRPPATGHSSPSMNRGPTTDLDQSGLPEEQVRAFRVPFARTEGGIELSYDGATFLFTPAEARRAAGTKRRASGSLIAPMPGIVAVVLVTEGQAVAAYQPLAVVEAMKVMATIEAPFAGTVARVYVQKRQQVRQGEALVDVMPIA